MTAITNIRRFWRTRKEGLLAGGLVGLIVALVYKSMGGTFSFATIDIQSRAAGSLAALSQAELSSVAFFATMVAWIIVGAIIGFLLDIKFGLRFSRKTRFWMLITALVLLAYVLFVLPIPIGNEGLGREAGFFKGIMTGIKALPKTMGTGWFGFLMFTIITGILSFIGNLLNPDPAIPIWIFFVAGFMIILFLKKRGQQEQPLIIER